MAAHWSFHVRSGSVLLTSAANFLGGDLSCLHPFRYHRVGALVAEMGGGNAYKGNQTLLHFTYDGTIHADRCEAAASIGAC